MSASIKATGLQAYLDDPKQLAEHRGNDFLRFRELLVWGWPLKAIGEEFGRSRVTIAKWRDILEEEPK